MTLIYVLWVVKKMERVWKSKTWEKVDETKPEIARTETKMNCLIF